MTRAVVMRSRWKRCWENIAELLSLTPTVRWTRADWTPGWLTALEVAGADDCEPPAEEAVAPPDEIAAPLEAEGAPLPEPEPEGDLVGKAGAPPAPVGLAPPCGAGAAADEAAEAVLCGVWALRFR